MVVKRLFGDSRFVVIDEAQKIRDIGLTLKVIHDAMPDLSGVRVRAGLKRRR